VLFDDEQYLYVTGLNDFMYPANVIATIFENDFNILRIIWIDIFFLTSTPFFWRQVRSEMAPA
jgi:hypothetical protein